MSDGMSTRPNPLSRSNGYDPALVRELIMGPNPLKLCEETLDDAAAHGCGLAPGSLVLDLGSGSGLTSAFLAAHWQARVVAADLWGNPTDALAVARRLGLSAQDVLPVHADACNLPFAEEAFDAVTCIDAYNYFGRDEAFLAQRLLPHVRRGGLVYLAISGLTCDVADFGGALPPELSCSWTPEQLEYLWPRGRWERLFAAEGDVRVERIRDLSCNDEAWRDWVACDNLYAAGDRAAIEAGALAWLTTTEVVLRRL